MATSNQLTPGMVISISGALYRVESCVRVTVPKGQPFIKSKLRDITSNKVIEKNFKLNQSINDVNLTERKVEFLYPEGKCFLFLDIGNLEHVSVPQDVVSKQAVYLKEGVELKAFFYGNTVFSVELPQFLELMVSKIEEPKKKSSSSNGRMAVLETGAKVDVPPFIEIGDIIKVDTKTDEYIQRV